METDMGESFAREEMERESLRQDRDQQQRQKVLAWGRLPACLELLTQRRGGAKGRSGKKMVGKKIRGGGSCYRRMMVLPTTSPFRIFCTYSSACSSPISVATS